MATGRVKINRALSNGRDLHLNNIGAATRLSQRIRAKKTFAATIPEKSPGNPGQHQAERRNQARQGNHRGDRTPQGFRKVGQMSVKNKTRPKDQPTSPGYGLNTTTHDVQELCPGAPNKVCNRDINSGDRGSSGRNDNYSINTYQK